MSARWAPLALVAFALAGCAAAPPAPRAAPELELRSIDGDPVRLSAWSGTPVLVELFGVHCGSCRAAMSQLLPYYEEFGADGRVRMLSVDLGARFDGLGAENESLVRAWRDEFGARWTFALDDAGGTAARAFAVLGRPTFYLVTAEGTLAWEHGGYVETAVLRAETARLVEGRG